MPGNKIPPGRLEEVERRILRANAPADFVPELAREWKCTRRAVWKYVARVRARLAERAKVADPDADRELVRAMLLRAYQTAEVGGAAGPQTSAMVQAARALGEVTGVVAPHRIEHSGHLISVDPKQLHDRLAAIVAKAAGELDPGAAVEADPEREG